MNDYYYFLLPFLICLIIFLFRDRQTKIAVIHNLKKKRKDNYNMKELAKRFIGKKCVVYTVIDTTGTVTGVIKEVDDTGILIESKDNIQAVNLEYIIRIREFPHKKNGKEKSVFF